MFDEDKESDWCTPLLMRSFLKECKKMENDELLWELIEKHELRAYRLHRRNGFVPADLTYLTDYGLDGCLFNQWEVLEFSEQHPELDKVNLTSTARTSRYVLVLRSGSGTRSLDHTKLTWRRKIKKTLQRQLHNPLALSTIEGYIAPYNPNRKLGDASRRRIDPAINETLVPVKLQSGTLPFI